MVTISSYQNLLRLDAAPTEVQMKLGISQVLSMPFAYNSPVIVLDFEVGNKNIIKGRFKDAIRSRVFEFEIGDSVTFKPFTWKRTDSLDIDPVAWEDFSKGYSYRYDAVKTPRKEKPTCGNTSYNCGKACIGLNKNCKSDPPDKPSQEKVDKLRAAAGEFKAVQDDPTKKQEDNKLTPKPPVSAPKQAPNSAGDKAREKVNGGQNKKVGDSGKITIDTGFHVRDTLVDKDKFNGLPEDQKKSILELKDQFDKLGYIDARTQIGPSQSARQSQSSRDKIAQTASKAFDIESKVKWLIKTPEEQSTIRSKVEIESLKKELESVKNGIKINNDFLSAKINSKRDNLTKREHQKLLDREKELEGAILTKQNPQSEPKPTPNSTGVKGAGGKSVDQQYKDIIASSKDPKGTEEAISEALADTLDFEKKTYERYLESQKNGTVPKGYEKHYQDHIDQYKPVIEAEQFLKERRKKALDGDFETEAEVRPYLLKMMDKYKKDYDYYDSPEYAEKREKLKSIVGEAPLPPVLSGKIPAKDLRQTLKPGDKLLRKQATYGYAGSSSGNTPTGWKYSDGGEVAKVAIKNVSTKINYGMGDRMFDDSVSMRDVTHVIRDGKRYKVDDSDSSPNDLKPESSKSQKAVKQKAVKQKTIKVQGERSQEQESPLIPKEEIVKDAPKLIGDGTHEGAPKNAQEYYDAAVKTGKAMTMKEAEDTVAAVFGWSRNSSDIRNDQKKGKFNKKAELISDYVRNSTPYNGDIHRGIVFNNREEAMEWIKGDENGVLDNQNAHASWTSKESVAWVYTNPMMRKANKTLAGVIVSSVNKTGASIEKLSRYKESEAEVLVAKDARHKVKSVTEKDSILYVQTEEI